MWLPAPCSWLVSGVKCALVKPAEQAAASRNVSLSRFDVDARSDRPATHAAGIIGLLLTSTGAWHRLDTVEGRAAHLVVHDKRNKVDDRW
eukprot:gene36885-51023_t